MLQLDLRTLQNRSFMPILGQIAVYVFIGFNYHSNLAESLAMGISLLPRTNAQESIVEVLFTIVYV